MSKRELHLKIDELKTSLGLVKGLEISIGRIFEETWEEPVGPTPFPGIADLRAWDRTLLNRYRPFYMPFCDVCCLCTFGKCDLTGDKRGACGIDMAAQQSRMVLLACCIGAATHISHARHLVEHLIGEYGRNYPIDWGPEVFIEAPVTRLVTGVRPKTLGDLEDILDYLETEVTHLLSCCHTGQEGDNIDFESKVFHAGMIDQVGMEIADLAQVMCYGFPKADPEAPFTEIGLGAVDPTKPVILVIGHNVPPAADIMDYLMEKKLVGQVELAGICCTAIDVTRYNTAAKIIGPISWQLRFIRSGIPDVIVVDEQCIRADILNEAMKIRAPLIAASEKAMHGLPDRTEDDPREIIDDLVSGRAPGAVILNPRKVGEVAVETALKVAPLRKKFKVLPDASELVEQAKRCRKCMECTRACPNTLPIPEAMEAAAKGDMSKLEALYDLCIGCGRCEHACPRGIPVHSMIVKAADRKFREEKYRIRVGRGAIRDTEIRTVGRPIVMGEIPGVVAFVGCANYPGAGRDIAEMVDEFARRNYIICTTGCAAMSAAMYKDEEGKTVYEKYPGVFDAGGVVNCGSCVSNPHIAGAAIKIASIFAKRSLRANYEEIADYIINRVGACGVAWGAMSQKAASIAAGFWRLGVPVVVGPHGLKYRRMLLGRKDRKEDWYVYDARTGERVYVGPVPEHLFYSAQTKEECMVMIAKLCMRPSDTTKGRAIKLTHYIDLHKKFFGRLPDDLHLLVRTKADIPVTMKDEVLEALEKAGWKEGEIATPDPTLVKRLVGAWYKR